MGTCRHLHELSLSSCPVHAVDMVSLSYGCDKPGPSNNCLAKQATELYFFLQTHVFDMQLFLYNLDPQLHISVKYVHCEIHVMPSSTKLCEQLSIELCHWDMYSKS